MFLKEEQHFVCALKRRANFEIVDASPIFCNLVLVRDSWQRQRNYMSQD